MSTLDTIRCSRNYVEEISLPDGIQVRPGYAPNNWCGWFVSRTDHSERRGWKSVGKLLRSPHGSVWVAWETNHHATLENGLPWYVQAGNYDTAQSAIEGLLSIVLDHSQQGFELCLVCGGDGIADLDDETPCRFCDGTGRYLEEFYQ